MPPEAGPAPLDAAAVLVRREGLAWQEVAGELVVLDLGGAMLRGFNRTGGLVWSLLDGRRSLRAVADAVAEHYRLEPARVIDDVCAFGGELVARGLAERAPG